MYGQAERAYRRRSPSRWSGAASESSYPVASYQCGSTFTRPRELAGSVMDSERGSCVSLTNDDVSSRDYLPSLRSSPYLPPAASKATQMLPPARDYRWNLIRNPPAQSITGARIPTTNPLRRSARIQNVPAVSARPTTMRRDTDHGRNTCEQLSTDFVDGRWVSRHAGVPSQGDAVVGEPRNAKMEKPPPLYKK